LNFAFGEPCVAGIQQGKVGGEYPHDAERQADSEKSSSQRSALCSMRSAIIPLNLLPPGGKDVSGSPDNQMWNRGPNHKVGNCAERSEREEMRNDQ
jgi:hypothetical protein